MADIRTLKLQLLADTAQFSTGLDKASTDTQSFTNKVDKIVANAAKAFLGLATAVGTAAFAIGVDSVKAAAEDEKAQLSLAKTLQNTIKATDGQIKKVEDYIDATQRATGVADDQLRPSFDRLIRSTKDVDKAIRLQNLALDIAAGTGKDLSTVTEGLSKLYDGNFTSLKKLGVPLDETIVKNKDLDGALKTLSETFGGQAAIQADTFAGKMNILKIKIGEIQETLGTALIGPLTKLADIFDRTVVPALEDFVAGLTGGEPNSVKNALRDAKGRVEELSAGVDQPGATGGYSLGASFRRLAETIADTNKELFGATGDESGLKKFLDLLTGIAEAMNNIIKAYEKLPDIAKFVVNPLPDLISLGRPISEAAGTVKQGATIVNQTVNIGATNTKSVANTVVKSINSAVKTGVSNKLASNSVLR